MKKRIFLTAFFLLFALALASVPLPAFQETTFLETIETGQKPFASGESLLYEVNWKPLFLLPAFKAGEIRLEINESQYQGIDTFQITGEVYSEGALTRITGLEVRNRFFSQVDRKNLRSYQNTQIIRQGKRQRDLTLTFDYARNRTTILETDPSFDPPKVLRNQVKPGISAPVTDILSVFYVARCKALSEGEELILHLNEKGSLKKIEVLTGSKEKIKTPVGEFPSIKLSTSSDIFKGGGELRIWYSTDSLRIPTKFEADVKFGKVYGELIRMDTPTQTRGILRLGSGE